MADLPVLKFAWPSLWHSWNFWRPDSRFIQKPIFLLSYAPPNIPNSERMGKLLPCKWGPCIGVRVSWIWTTGRGGWAESSWFQGPLSDPGKTSRTLNSLSSFSPLLSLMIWWIQKDLLSGLLTAFNRHLNRITLPQSRKKDYIRERG